MKQTNSAYMLFYERIPEDRVAMDDPMTSLVADDIVDMAESHKFKVELSKELNDWIWQDNMQFLQVTEWGRKMFKI